MSAPTRRYEDAVARCFEAWNAGPGARAKAVAAAWTNDGGSTDPLADVCGHEQNAAVITGGARAVPGFVFRLSGAVDGHHDTARFSWELVSETGGTPSGGGSAPVAGSDVVTLDDEGRFRDVHGFLDRVPAGA